MTISTSKKVGMAQVDGLVTKICKPDRNGFIFETKCLGTYFQICICKYAFLLTFYKNTI